MKLLILLCACVFVCAQAQLIDYDQANAFLADFKNADNGTDDNGSMSTTASPLNRRRNCRYCWKLKCWGCRRKCLMKCRGKRPNPPRPRPRPGRYFWKCLAQFKTCVYKQNQTMAFCGKQLGKCISSQWNKTFVNGTVPPNVQCMRNCTSAKIDCLQLTDPAMRKCLQNGHVCKTNCIRTYSNSSCLATCKGGRWCMKKCQGKRWMNGYLQKLRSYLPNIPWSRHQRINIRKKPKNWLRRIVWTTKRPLTNG